MTYNRIRGFDNPADVNVLIEAVHGGSRVEISSKDLESVIEHAVAAGVAKAKRESSDPDNLPEGVSVDIVIRAVHDGAKVVIR